MSGRTTSADSQAPGPLVLDSGAVIGLAHGDARARAVVAAAIESGVEITVPVNVVAETVRGRDADAPVQRVLRSIGSVSVLDEPTARLAGTLLGSTGSAATIDATVVATASRAGGGVVLTGDPHDLAVLAAAVPGVRVRAL